ncbi:hypothetical protein ACFV4N_23885 [Actinosynnema sp. NPDC059797]
MTIEDQHPAIRRLAALGPAGWGFVHQRDEETDEVVRITAFFQWPSGPLDCVRIDSPDHAFALRSDGGDPPRIMWEFVGTVAEAVDRIMDLPPPTHRYAPRSTGRLAPGPKDEA